MIPADVSFATSAQRIFAGSNSFSLIAIPFFILAGNTMIVYSSVAGSVSIAAPFMAGYIPGIKCELSYIYINPFFLMLFRKHRGGQQAARVFFVSVKV